MQTGIKTFFKAIPLMGLLLLFFNLNYLNAQKLTQTIRGRVVDKQTQQALPGVNVLILTHNTPKGTITDTDGFFEFNDVNVGRHKIKCSYLGYGDVLLPNLDLKSTKQLVLNIEMEEQLEQLEEVVVKAHKKSETINRMAINSARTFSVEETERYPGSRGDVARMAMNFAGVRGANDEINEIVIRGNSPVSMLWRLDGMDIPNPNHFSYGEVTSGPISMLNNNLLSNSDFFTGAWPAEYGNAISGVFDLHLRNGNNQDHEFLAQVGLGGYEFGAEGPMSRAKKSSYLINYRYSTLGVMYALGFDFGTAGAVPFYQDLTAKFNFPTNNIGTFSLVALGGKSNIDLLDSKKDKLDHEEYNIYKEYEQDVYNKQVNGILGLNHKYILSNSAYTKFTLFTSYAQTKNVVDSVIRIVLPNQERDNISTFDQYRGNLQMFKTGISLYYHKKFNAKNNLRVGGSAKLNSFDMIDSAYMSRFNRFITTSDFDGNSWFIQPYVNWQHKFSNTLKANVGLTGQWFTYNNSYSIEPRLGLSWQATPRNRFSASYGLHSYMIPTIVIMQETYNTFTGNLIKTNTDIDFTKAHHFVLAHDFDVTPTVRLKSELYYQYIYDAAVESSPSNYSMLNYGFSNGEFKDSLVNGGTGYNYGLELTFEKFMEKGFYFLTTASLYNSKYKGSKGELRNTTFNCNYVFNAVGGKEIPLGKNEKKVRSLTIDTKFYWSGGQRYSPVDIDASESAGYTQYNDNRAYDKQLTDYYRFDIRIGFKSSRKRVSEEFAIDIQNVTGHNNQVYPKYDKSTGNEVIKTTSGFLPMALYRITF